MTLLSGMAGFHQLKDVFLYILPLLVVPLCLSSRRLLLVGFSNTWKEILTNSLSAFSYLA